VRTARKDQRKKKERKKDKSDQSEGLQRRRASKGKELTVSQLLWSHQPGIIRIKFREGGGEELLIRGRFLVRLFQHLNELVKINLCLSCDVSGRYNIIPPKKFEESRKEREGETGGQLWQLKMRTQTGKSFLKFLHLLLGGKVPERPDDILQLAHGQTLVILVEGAKGILVIWEQEKKKKEFLKKNHTSQRLK